jgi:MoxR-like ATPase
VKNAFKIGRAFKNVYNKENFFMSHEIVPRHLPEILRRGHLVDQAIQAEVGKVVFGSENKLLVDILITALFADGHVLVEAPVGLGKTLTCRALARTIGCRFSRISFLPDMLPSEVSGYRHFNQETRVNEVHHGPLFHPELPVNIVLADEINRATPKTQAALLEAMGEGQITIEGVTYRLADPFMVLATENPIEHDGTYPLPEAQLDRFMARAVINGTSADTMKTVLADKDYHRRIGPRLERIQPVTTPEEIVAIREAIFDNVYVEGRLADYIWNLTEATGRHPSVAFGASPRGAINLKMAAQVAAFRAGIREQTLPSGQIIKGYFVTPKDVQDLATTVLAHRIFMKPEARFSQYPTSPAQIVQEILHAVKPD